jgi:hypothetical protein
MVTVVCPAFDMMYPWLTAAACVVPDTSFQVREPTPVEAIDIEPEPEVIVIPVPWVKVAPDGSPAVLKQ